MNELKQYYESQSWNQPLIVKVGLNLDSYLRAIGYIKSKPGDRRDIVNLSDKELSAECNFAQDEVDIVRAFELAELDYDPNYYAHSGFQGCFIGKLRKIQENRLLKGKI